MFDIFGTAMRTITINPGMQMLDWVIVFGVIIFLIAILFYCNRYMRNAADFLAASRCAGRYVLSISEGIAGFAVVSSVATFESFYKSGFAAQWWTMLQAPIGLILGLVAWVTYRLRETRCFTLAQFYEVRYSRKFRIAAGILTWTSGIVNYGIFPAVSVRFFMFFCRFPEYYEFLGINWNVYGTVLFIAIGLGVFFAAFGGQIAVMVTDFVQGIMCNVAFVIFIFFIFKLGEWDVSGGFVSWKEIAEALSTAPGKSQINPFDSGKIGEFNMWYYVIGIIASIYGRGAWQGSMGYAAAAKTPHERKMAGLLGTWRGMAQGLMIMLFPLAVIAIMHHQNFTGLAAAINDQLHNSGVSAQLQEQGLVATALSLIMPTGLLGLFVAVMFSAMLSTDDTYMHSWGSIFIQDVIMPFRKKAFTATQHIWALRLSILGVGAFAWCFSFFFRQTDYVYMFFAITGAIVSGAGAALVGGLYWKRGGTLAAWVSYIVGAFLAVSGIIIQQLWNPPAGFSLAKYLADTFHWEWVINNMEKFPVNGQYVNFICIMTCTVLYIVVSLFEHYVLGKKDFNLDKMLHRGKYDTANEHQTKSEVGRFARIFGITPEFTLGDKIIYGASIGWTLMWFLFFIWFTIQNFTIGVSNSQWLALWHFKLFLTLILGIGCTVWFLIGGIVDISHLFIALKTSVRNDVDDGSVVDGGNAGEKQL